MARGKEMKNRWQLKNSLIKGEGQGQICPREYAFLPGLIGKEDEGNIGSEFYRPGWGKIDVLGVTIEKPRDNDPQGTVINESKAIDK